MKVVKPGVVFFANNHTTVMGWEFQAEEGETYTEKGVLVAVLNHIARFHEVENEAAEIPERLTLDQERMALDAIAGARWNWLDET